MLAIQFTLDEPLEMPADIVFNSTGDDNSRGMDSLFTIALWPNDTQTPPIYFVVGGQSERVAAGADTPAGYQDTSLEDPQITLLSLQGGRSSVGSFKAEPATLNAGNWTLLFALGTAASLSVDMVFPDGVVITPEVASGCGFVYPSDFRGKLNVNTDLGARVIQQVSAEIDVPGQVFAWFYTHAEAGETNAWIDFPSGERLSHDDFPHGFDPIAGHSAGTYTFHIEESYSIDMFGHWVAYCAW